MTNPLRILMTTDAIGGVWQYSLDLACGLGAQRVETVLAVMGPPPSPEQRAAAARVPGLTVIETRLPLDWLAPDQTAVAKASDSLARLADTYDADLVHLNMPALAANLRLGVPVVAVSHSCIATWWCAMHRGEAPPPDFAWRIALTGAGLRRADSAVTPSAAFAEATMKAHRLRRRPVVVHNGRRLLKLPRAARADLVFTAGRLWDQSKNMRLLDQVAARLPVPFSAAGPVRGPNGETVTLKHVRRLGTLGEAAMAECLAARPIFVSAARYEPFGLAVLEAAAAGCPLILSDIRTFRELWEDCAIFVDPDDGEAFRKAIATLLAETTLRTALGKAARTRAQRFTPGAMAASMAAVYRELQSSRRTAAASAAPSAAQVATA